MVTHRSHTNSRPAKEGLSRSGHSQLPVQRAVRLGGVETCQSPKLYNRGGKGRLLDPSFLFLLAANGQACPCDYQTDGT